MSKGSEISQDDYKALAEFRYQIRRFLHFSEQLARKAGIEPQHHQLLLTLKGMPEHKQPTIGELAERLQLQHHSTVELIDRLVERGFVERHKDEVDQRRVLIYLTPVGDAILQELSLLHRNELRMTGPALAEALNAIILHHYLSPGQGSISTSVSQRITGE